MLDGADPQEPLEDLQRLSEAGRERYLKMLPPEDIAGALKAALRERDTGTHHEGSTGREYVKSAQPAAKDVIRAQQVLKDKDNAGIGSTKKDNGGTQRDAVDAVRVLEKRTRSLSLHQPPRKRKQRIRKKAAASHAQKKIQQSHVAQREHENPDGQTTKTTEELPIVLQIRVPEFGTMTKDISDALVSLERKVRKRFEDMRSASERRTRVNNRILENPKKYLDKPCCVRQLLVTTDINPTMHFGGKLNESADDRCNNAEDPCIYLALHDEVPTLCIVPLPPALRAGLWWKDVGFWLVPKED
ncbi:hypothetical protein EK21DRAFT_79303 [Setomelanomma holmii]|uniref:Uncharacterized protein n=1 Tax=Setomelanomma holmii TaxID=210430 RepID=A0A9P4LGA8_9PLEO|nr:hypothetical protein EK21DRAFT_79303 [Setomelanomma holmii]